MADVNLPKTPLWIASSRSWGVHATVGAGFPVVEAIEKAITRVIETMHENLGEQLTVDDMARTAMFSKFYFTRVFQRVTGISPGRFLSAIRLQEAKRLLVATSLSVTEISHRVGYASVGTFSSRFRNSVGISPTTYRELGGFTSRIYVDDRRAFPGMRQATIRGEVQAPPGGSTGLVFVGLFPDRMPHGRPVRCTVLHNCGQYVLHDVPQGNWYLLTHSAAAGSGEDIRRVLDGDDVLYVGSAGPIPVGASAPSGPVDVRLRPTRKIDPPVLLALLDVRSVALGADML